MTKKEVRAALKAARAASHKTHRTPAEELEKALSSRGVKYTHDSNGAIVIWCTDGVLEFAPVHN